ncbi:MAG: hypothetical protein ACRDPD_12570 [Streptosporangiaceae bacterium]
MTCFRCYAVNDHPTGSCDVCGQPVEAPAGLPWTGSLIWALVHPDGDRAVQSGRTLGRLRACESIPALRAAEAGKDIYLRAAALRSFIEIEGAGSLGPWLEHLSRDAPLSMRNIALRALEDTAGEP